MVRTPLFDLLLAGSTGARILATVLMIFPLGFFHGNAVPAGNPALAEVLLTVPSRGRGVSTACSRFLEEASPVSSRYLRVLAWYFLSRWESI